MPANCLRSVRKRMAAGEKPSKDLVYGATPSGLGNLSRRAKSTKPIIAAVNGMAYGGAMEMVINCDLVVASEGAVFGAVEVYTGLAAIHGGTTSC